jgi:hypothetical protein
MSRRKRTLLAVGLLALTAAIGAVTIFHGQESAPSWVQRIRHGMTSAETQLVLRDGVPDSASECWFTDNIQSCNRDGWVLQLTYENDRVVDIRNVGGRPLLPASFFARLRRWLRL